MGSTQKLQQDSYGVFLRERISKGSRAGFMQKGLSLAVWDFGAVVGWGGAKKYLEAQTVLGFRLCWDCPRN